MDENVAKAVAAINAHADDLRRCAVVLRAYPEMQPVAAEFSEAVGELTAASTTIRARLVELEAENERLNAAWDSSFKQAMQNGQSAQVQRARAEKAEANLEAANKAVDTYREMLVSIIKVVRERDDRQLQAHIDATGITAHLSENSRG